MMHYPKKYGGLPTYVSSPDMPYILPAVALPFHYSDIH